MLSVSADLRWRLLCAGWSRVVLAWSVFHYLVQHIGRLVDHYVGCRCTVGLEQRSQTESWVSQSITTLCSSTMSNLREGILLKKEKLKQSSFDKIDTIHLDLNERSMTKNDPLYNRSVKEILHQFLSSTCWLKVHTQFDLLHRVVITAPWQNTLPHLSI